MSREGRIADMQRRKRLSSSLPVTRHSRLPVWVVGLAFVGCGVALRAQEAAAKAEDQITTLHVYTNSIQIPAVVLGPNRQWLSPIAPDKFSVSIDSGPWFRATHVRREEDDPISLAILLDANGESTELFQGVEEAITKAKVFPLRPEDRISVYGLDCSLVLLLDEVPADASLKERGAGAFASWDRRRARGPDTGCQEPMHLWDALIYVSGEVSKSSRLRVVLAVSQGKDRGSKHTWNEVRDYAESNSVAVFGLTEVPPDANAPIGQISTTLDVGESITRAKQPLSPIDIVWSTENPFHQVCELSGGMVFVMPAKYVSGSMKAFMRAVRERYIIEFPRPSNATSGRHTMRVQIAHGERYFIRPAGISVPQPDPAILADPTTVSAGPKDTPEMGSRKVLSKPQ
jgi:hypothetical protein